MSTDPREVFRPHPRNCGSCEHWYHDLMEPTDFPVQLPIHQESGTVELPCRLAEGGKPGASNYENGWRRGSDSCLKWERRRG